MVLFSIFWKLTNPLSDPTWPIKFLGSRKDVNYFITILTSHSTHASRSPASFLVSSMLKGRKSYFTIFTLTLSGAVVRAAGQMM